MSRADRALPNVDSWPPWRATRPVLGEVSVIDACAEGSEDVTRLIAVSGRPMPRFFCLRIWSAAQSRSISVSWL